MMRYQIVVISMGLIGCNLIRGGDQDLRILITNNTSDQILLAVIETSSDNTSTEREESAQLMPPGEFIDMTLRWGYYRLSFRNTVYNKTVSVDRSTLTNISATCVAINLTPGLYPGVPYVGFSAVCTAENPSATIRKAQS